MSASRPGYHLLFLGAPGLWGLRRTCGELYTLAVGTSPSSPRARSAVLWGDGLALTANPIAGDICLSLLSASAEIKMVGTERGNQRADRLKLQSQTASQSDHMDHSLF